MQIQAITLSDKERNALKKTARSKHSESRQILRAKIILLADRKKRNKEIAEILGVSIQKVARWKKRFALYGIPGIMKDAPRSGRPVLITQSDIDTIIHVLLNEKPMNSDRWSVRTLAARVNKTRYATHKILRDFGINLEESHDLRALLDPRGEPKKNDRAA
ncbi:MAG: helix-turn-helix domain-containing protein [Thermoguttaceae bacterium]|nr:helix-turn-helix domain-containing protein [Thermoguttaceae bacterium]